MMTTDTAPDLRSTRFSACLLFSANALARAVTSLGDEAFSKLGLSYSHAYLLTEVALQPGQTPTVLSEKLFLTPSTITRLIEKLESKQLVHRTNEGKNTHVFPTEAGEALAPAVTDAWVENWAKFTAALGEDEARTLTRLVFQAAEALAQK